MDPQFNRMEEFRWLKNQQQMVVVKLHIRGSFEPPSTFQSHSFEPGSIGRMLSFAGEAAEQDAEHDPTVDKKERKNGNDLENELKDSFFFGYKTSDSLLFTESRAFESSISLSEEEKAGFNEYGDIDATPESLRKRVLSSAADSVTQNHKKSSLRPKMNLFSIVF